MINHKELNVKSVYKDKKSLGETNIIEDLIFWKERLNIAGKKNNAIFTRPINNPNSVTQNLTGDQFSITSLFHGYGGQSYKCIKSNNQLFIVWIDQISKSIWINSFKFINSGDYKDQFPYLISNDQPRKLTKSITGNFDASFVLIEDKILFGLIEIHNVDYLFKVDIFKEEQDLVFLKKFNNFAGSLSSNISANLLSWIEWDFPFMPWENNNLFFAELDNNCELKLSIKLDKKIISNCEKISFFQPYWLSDNLLVCSEDSSGWWNLIFFEVNDLNNINIRKRIVKEFFEYGLPQWVSGISLFSGLKDNFYCLAKHKDNWILENYQNLHFVRKIDLPYTTLSDLKSYASNLILKASNQVCEEKLIELEIKSLYKIQIKQNKIKPLESISQAESIWFEGFDKKKTHAWIYKPTNSYFQKPPLIVKAHSGPTGYFNGSLNPEVQFWTSRGWCIAEVNYGGSSSFGKEYLNRLNGNWGIVDSMDCRALVKILISEELVDRTKVVAFGNSAGGLTVFNALCGDTLIKAAICKYPVLDLNQMHFNTHRFEKDYLNSLIGNFEDNKDQYFDRSPINKIQQISQPVLIFHGKKDFVIDYRNSLEFHKKLLNNNIYSEIHIYQEEGHGFKNLKNKINCLNVSEKFLKKIFN